MRLPTTVVLLGLALISCTKDEKAPKQAESREEIVEAAKESPRPSETEFRAKRNSESQSARMAYLILAHADSRLGALQERSAEEALELARSLAERIRGGESSKTLAREFSDDPDLESHGGELTVLNSGNESTDGTPRARFEDVADQLFQLQKAEVAVVVPADPKTSLGIWVIQRID